MSVPDRAFEREIFIFHFGKKGQLIDLELDLISANFILDFETESNVKLLLSIKYII